MRIGVMGTGAVGTTIATKLVALGHEVMIGSRTADNPNAAEWVAATGDRASQGTFADAAAFGALLFNCTAGQGSLAALGSARAEDLAGKVLADVSNSLDASQGFPPSLLVSNTDSLGEQIQRAFPGLRVVKTLNTVNRELMVQPSLVPGEHAVFLSGDDDAAKQEVVTILSSMGWPEERIVDLGDITTARGPEMYIALWLRLMASLGTPHFNVSIVR